MKVRNLRRYVILATCVTMLLGAALSTPVAAQGSVAAPIPYPDAPDIGVGGGDIQRISMDQLVQYKALPEYHQAPSLDKFVADGTLPEVKDRLPKEPAVMMTAGMKDGIGVYGDLWRGFSGCPVAGYNEA